MAVYSICTIMLVFSLIYAIVFIKESPLANVDSQTEQQTSFAKRSVLAQFFDYHHVINTFQVIFKDGPKRRRVRIILLLLSWIVVTGPTQGAICFLFNIFNFFFLYPISRRKRSLLFHASSVQMDWSGTQLLFHIQFSDHFLG